jgi:predicted lactoylglutathione lyase
MTCINSVTLESPHPATSESFSAAAFGLGSRVRLRQAHAESDGFRGFTLSLVVSQPANVDELVGAALTAGATTLKPVKKTLWGYGGVMQAPDGAIWKIATSSKKNTRPASREIDDVVLLLGVADVLAAKRYYSDHGLTVDKSFGRKYVQFTAAPDQITLALYERRALAKDAGIPPEGSGSHRIVIESDAGTFVDPDGFEWAAGVS